VKRIVPLVALVLLLAPVTAQAKGTNIRVSDAPNGTDAGEPWVTNVIVTMPGMGRIDAVMTTRLSPRMVIRKGSARRTFPALPTGKPGVYRVRVVFPSRGEWSYGVEDGFGGLERGAGRVHRFPPVKIAAGQPTLAKPPRPISGDIRFEMQAASDVAPRGQLPPETFRVASTEEHEDDGSGAMFPALAFVLAAAVAGPVWLRRRRNNKRAT
jgi:hypothetical protein